LHTYRCKEIKIVITTTNFIFRLYSAVIQDAESSFDITVGLKNMIKKGTLCMRPPKGGDVWPEQHFFINAAEMVAVNVEEV
jgi:hypothetical protein